MQAWISKVRDELLGRRDRAGVWGYRIDRGPSIESTALAGLGLWAHRDAESPGNLDVVVRRGADWLLSMQQADGSLCVCPSLPTPGWATPLAILLWRAMQTHTASAEHAAAWLIAHRGERLNTEKSHRAVVGHDGRLVGWPWVEGTHSWLEPTAMAILALNQMRLGDHPRRSAGGH